MLNLVLMQLKKKKKKRLKEFYQPDVNLIASKPTRNILNEVSQSKSIETKGLADGNDLEEVEQGIDINEEQEIVTNILEMQNENEQFRYERKRKISYLLNRLGL